MRSLVVAVLSSVGCTGGRPPADPVAARAALGAEVEAMFAELRAREEQYRLESATYLSTGADETELWPAKPSRPPRPIASLPDAWTALRVIPPADTVACAYVVIAGGFGESANLGPRARAVGFTDAPASPWFYALPRCDHRRGPPTYYVTSSVDASIRTQE